MEADSFGGTLEQYMASCHNLREMERRLRKEKQNRSFTVRWLLESGGILVLVLSG